MTSSQKKSPWMKDVRRHDRRAVSPQLSGSVAGQPKKAMAAPVAKPPLAPPAHRQQNTPKVLQAKMPVQQQPLHPSKPTPPAPPVYRPQPIPRVLQAKTAGGKQQQGQPPRKPVAPPVYRPEQKKIVQPKAVSPKAPLPARPHPPVAPPIYRPETKLIQPKQAQRTTTAGQAKQSVPMANRVLPGAVRGGMVTPASRQALRSPTNQATRPAAQPPPNLSRRASNQGSTAVVQRALDKGEKDMRENEIRDVLFAAEIAEEDYDLPTQGMARFQDGVRRNAANMVNNTAVLYPHLTGYQYQLEQIIAQSSQNNLADVESHFNGVLAQNRYADMELNDGTYIECKAYALANTTSDSELAAFFGQAYDYAHSGNPVIYRFKNGAPTWAETTLFCVRQWTGHTNIMLDGNVAPVYRGQEANRHDNEIVAKLRTLYNTRFGNSPPPL